MRTSRTDFTTHGRPNGTFTRCRRRLAGATALAALFLTGSAQATPDFPDFIKSELGLSEAPHCALCHVGTPGRGTVQTAFGKYARSRGLSPRDNDSLKSVLAAARGERHDSDGDGFTDIDEMEAGQDPNGDQPEFGCVGRVAQGGSASPSASGIVLLGLVFACWRRRRRTS